MSVGDDVEFYRSREAQELRSSELATDPHIRRLHWEMAQRYNFLALRAEDDVKPNAGVPHIRSSLGA
ncbi:MAG TPA: hypothetical protein VF509_04510 [Sphingobium sp.]